MMRLRIVVGGCLLIGVAASGAWKLQSSLAQEATLSAAPASDFGTPAAGSADSKNQLPGLPGAEQRANRNNFYYYTEVKPKRGQNQSADGLVHFTIRDGGDAAGHALQQAAAALRDAKDDESKGAAQRQLSELLDKYFEEDMQRREAELAKVESRLKNLRELAQRRRENKQEIVELQIKVLLNEANGLGFFSQPAGPPNADPAAMPANYPRIRKAGPGAVSAYAPATTTAAASAAPIGVPVATPPATTDDPFGATGTVPPTPANTSGETFDSPIGQPSQ